VHAARRLEVTNMRALALLVAMVFAVAPAAAQWLRHPTAGIPRTADGRPDLRAAAPRSAEGRPALAGLWRPSGRIIFDIATGLKPGDTIPYQPWAEKLVNERRADDTKDDPTAACIVGGVPRSDFVPYPFKILEMPGLVVILYEAIHSYRQIFTDGRTLPRDPNPAWFGYSVGRWDGNVFVVESSGFNDNVWLDNAGRPATGALRVTERFRRVDFGRMDIEVTIDDPKAYTRPWTVTQPLQYQADDEIIEYMCNENNKFFQIVPDAAPPGARRGRQP
jgi:hypothetical protein